MGMQQVGPFRGLVVTQLIHKTARPSYFLGNSMITGCVQNRKPLKRFLKKKKLLKRRNTNQGHLTCFERPHTLNVLRA